MILSRCWASMLWGQQPGANQLLDDLSSGHHAPLLPVCLQATEALRGTAEGALQRLHHQRWWSLCNADYLPCYYSYFIAVNDYNSIAAIRALIVLSAGARSCATVSGGKTSARLIYVTAESADSKSFLLSCWSSTLRRFSRYFCIFAGRISAIVIVIMSSYAKAATLFQMA